MNQAFERIDLPRPAAIVLMLFVAFGGMLLFLPHGDYPQLHSILDTSFALLSAPLAILLWITISFGPIFVLEPLHEPAQPDYFDQIMCKPPRLREMREALANHMHAAEMCTDAK